MLSSKSKKRNQYENITYISGFKFFARGRHVRLALSKPALAHSQGLCSSRHGLRDRPLGGSGNFFVATVYAIIYFTRWNSLHDFFSEYDRETNFLVGRVSTFGRAVWFNSRLMFCKNTQLTFFSFFSDNLTVHVCTTRWMEIIRTKSSCLNKKHDT